MNPIKVNVKSCARCGKDHDQLEFKPLTNPIGLYSHAADCPEIKEPILLKIDGNAEVPVVLHLFDAKEEWTDIARAYDSEVQSALRPIYEAASKRGHSLKDLTYVVTIAAHELTLLNTF